MLKIIRNLCVFSSLLLTTNAFAEITMHDTTETILANYNNQFVGKVQNWVYSSSAFHSCYVSVYVINDKGEVVGFNFTGQDLTFAYSLSNSIGKSVSIFKLEDYSFQFRF